MPDIIPISSGTDDDKHMLLIHQPQVGLMLEVNAL